MTDLTKDEVSAVAQKAGAIISPQWGIASNIGTATFERFATICRAPLVAEVAALKADSEQLRSALGKALYAMEFHQWNWNSAASDDFKREAVQHVRKAIAKEAA